MFHSLSWLRLWLPLLRLQPWRGAKLFVGIQALLSKQPPLRTSKSLSKKASPPTTNRGLAQGVSESGWTAEEIQKGLKKEYKVNVVYVTRFLYSKKGYKFLENQTKSYFPYWGMKKTAVQALRSAIILASEKGKLSSVGIMKKLRVDMRLADTCGTFDGSQNVCAKGKCQGDQQCTSLMSWYVFLPACIQANQIKDTVASRPVRGLW